MSCNFNNTIKSEIKKSYDTAFQQKALPVCIHMYNTTCMYCIIKTEFHLLSVCLIRFHKLLQWQAAHPGNIHYQLKSSLLMKPEVIDFSGTCKSTTSSQENDTRDKSDRAK